MIDDKKIDQLSHIEAFIEFLDEIKDRRDLAIGMMADKPSEQIQQLAGRILEGDDILSLGGYAKIEERRKAR
jgi:hypothetical protein